MPEQVAGHYLDENERVWELESDQVDGPVRVWEVEANAVRDLKAAGWAIEGSFPLSREFSGMPKVEVWGYLLQCGVQ